MDSKFTHSEKAASAEREARMRRGFYKKLVAGNKMTQEAADREVALMEEIATDYRAADTLFTELATPTT